MTLVARSIDAGRRFWRRRQEWRRLTQILDRRSLAQLGLRGVAALPDIVRSGNTQALNDALAGTRCHLDVDGRQLTLDGQLLPAIREIYARAVYEALPGFRPLPGDTVIDLGANAGVFTVLAASVAERVLAVEAQAGFAAVIEQNAQQNGLAHKITIVQALVGGDSGILSDPERLQSASHYQGKEPARMTMDELLAQHDVARVQLLKCDIEGSEYALLNGSRAWLQRVDRMVMEVHAAFGDPDAFAAQLAGEGFRVTLLSDDLEVVPALSGREGYCYAIRH